MTKVTREITDTTVCPHTVFNALPGDLQLHEPRFGCAARATIILEWLLEQRFEAGRIWATPVKKPTFLAPLKDIHGSWLKEPSTSVSPRPDLSWSAHTAAYAMSDEGAVVYDPAIFDGPVLAQTWADFFLAQDNPKKDPAVKIDLVGPKDHPPLRNGIKYTPGGYPRMKSDDDVEHAMRELIKITRASEDTFYKPVTPYRPMKAPAFENRPLLNRACESI